MYTFVFNWVPAMFRVYPASDDGSPVPLGSIFSTFMVCITIGGALYELASSMGCPTEKSALVIFGAAAAALAVPAAYPDSLVAVYGGFLLFETCVGASSACTAALRSATMPESLQVRQLRHH